ncbi:MAG TPA: hypothetical protein VGF45_03165 [Polyangia bacterium]
MNDIDLWPAPPSARFAQRHEQMRLAMFDALVRVAAFVPAEVEVLKAVLTSMNREIERAFDQWVEPQLRAGAPLPEENRLKFLEAWMAAADVAHALIGNIKEGAADAVERARFIPHAQMDLENTRRHLAFYERYQRHTPEDQAMRALIEKKNPGPMS